MPDICPLRCVPDGNYSVLVQVYCFSEAARRIFESWKSSVFDTFTSINDVLCATIRVQVCLFRTCSRIIPKIHVFDFSNSLPREKGVQITEEMMDWGDELSNYSVDVRYPNQLQIDEYRTKKAMEKM